MAKIGKFLFRYRNGLFPLIYFLVFVPSANLWPDWRLPLLLGTLVAIAGQVMRAFSIGWVYIIRGGKNRRFYAEGLVTEGVFAHSRNPLYLGNILIALGVGIALNSFVFVAVGGTFFVFAYRAIVAGEEEYLRAEYGKEFERYKARVPRFIPNLGGIGETWREHRFKWRRLLVKEYGTTFVWIAGILLGKLYQFHRLGITGHEPVNRWLWVLFGVTSIAYLAARAAKKTGLVVAD